MQCITERNVTCSFLPSEMGRLTSPPGGSPLWLPFCCPALVPGGGRVTADHAGFPEPPAFLIMCSQENAFRHTGRLQSQVFTLSRFVFLLLLFLLGLGEKCESTSCCVCPASGSESPLQWGYSGGGVRLPCRWDVRGGDCFHRGKVSCWPGSAVGARSPGDRLGYIPAVSTWQRDMECLCPFGPESSALQNDLQTFWDRI